MSDQPLPGVNLIRNSVADGKNSTFVDFKDIKPINETVAMVSGAVGGAFLGALPGLMVGKKNEPLLSQGMLIASTSIGGILGGITAAMSAKTHNNWSEKVLQMQANNSAQHR